MAAPATLAPERRDGGSWLVPDNSGLKLPMTERLSVGVGYRTWQAYTIVDYPAVFVGMITIGVLGFATSALVELAGRRITRWLPREVEG